MTKEKTPMTEEDARRIQRAVDRKKGGGDTGFKRRAMSTAAKRANRKQGK